MHVGFDFLFEDTCALAAVLDFEISMYKVVYATVSGHLSQYSCNLAGFPGMKICMRV